MLAVLAALGVLAGLAVLAMHATPCQAMPWAPLHHSHEISHESGRHPSYIQEETWFPTVRAV